MNATQLPWGRAILAAVAFALQLTFGGAAIAATDQTGDTTNAWGNESNLSWQWRELNLANEALSAGVITDSWDTGIFISEKALLDILDLQKDSAIQITAVPVVGTLNIKVEKVAPLEDPDYPAVRLVLLLSKPGLDAWTMPVEAEALLVHRRTERIDDSSLKSRMFFGLRVVRWSSGARVGPVDLRRAPDPFTGLQAELIMHLFGQRMEFPIPIDPSLPIDMQKLTKDMTPDPIEIPKTGEKVPLMFSYKGTPEFDPYYAVSLHVRGGIWLLSSSLLMSRTRPVGPPPWVNEAPTNATLKALKAKVSSLRRSRTPQVAGATAAFINKTAFESILNPLREEAMRTIEMQSTRGAKLFHDDVLGVNVLVEGRMPDFIAGHAVIGNPSFAWEDRSLQIEAPLTFAGRLWLRTYFKPPNVPKEKTVVRMKGWTTLSGKFRLTVEDVGGVPMALLVPNLKCVNLHLEAEEGGLLNLQMKTGTLIFKKPVHPLIILDDVPKTFDFAVRPSNDKPKGMAISFTPAVRFVDVIATPVSARTTRTGFWLETDLKFSAGDPDQARAKAAKQKLKTASENRLTAHLEKNPMPDEKHAPCPRQEETRIKVLGFEIGPNGDLTKLFAWILQHGEEVVKEVEETGRRIDRERLRAQRQVEQGIKNLADNLGKLVPKKLPKLPG